MNRFKELIPSNVRDCIAATVITVGGGMVVLKVCGAVVRWVSNKRLQRRWKTTPKDVVILHRILPALTCPNASPFVLKLETYLRMAKIPYEVDLNDVWSAKGKTPWITLNGEHVADSQLCIEYLSKKFEKQIGKYSDAERGVAALVRLVLDEHFYWGLLMWRYVYSSSKGYGPDKVFPIPKILLQMWMPFMRRNIRMAAWFQGVGRHSEADIVTIMCNDLRYISNVLGSKKFILGDEPCEDDCAIFGELAQVLWCMPGSTYEKLMNEELHNLRDYCFRMKELYWPDWEDQIAKKS